MKNATIDIVKVTDQAIKIVTDPQAFYRAMPKSGGFQQPLLFAGLMAIAAAAVTFVLAVLGMGSAAHMGFGAVILFVAFPLGAVILCFLFGAFLYVTWRLMGSEQDYETSVRCVAFSTAILPVIAALSIFAWLANIVQVIWGCVLMYFASVSVHKRAVETSQVVFGVIGAILVLGVMF